MARRLKKNQDTVENPRLRAAIYLRVSSERQAERDTSIPSQEAECRRYAENKGYDILPNHIYTDAAKSARKIDRPAFQKMFQVVKAGRRTKSSPFDVLLVWKFSRFARNREDSIILKKMLAKQGIKVVSVSEPIDEGAHGKLVEGMIELLDEFYSESLAGETRRGMEENTRQGWRSGGSSPFGYKYIHVEVGKAKKGKLVLVPEEAEVVKRIFDLASSGLGCNTISARLNDEGHRTQKGKRWSKVGVNQVLRNRAYVGDTAWGKRRKGPDGNYHVVPESEWVIARDTHEPIVCREVFEYVGQRMSARDPLRVPAGIVASQYALSGLVRCAGCGGAMVLTHGRGRSDRVYHYYTCARRAKDKGACDGRNVRQDVLERAVFARIERDIFSDANLDIMVRDVMRFLDGLRTGAVGDIRKAQGALDEVRGRIRKQVLALEDDVVDTGAIRERISELRRQEEAKLTELAKLQARHVEAMPSPAALKADLSRFREALKEAILGGTAEERKSLLREFVEKVVVKKKGVKIIYGLPASRVVDFKAKKSSGKQEFTRVVNKWLLSTDSNRGPSD